jgi:potassium efflux system protein
MSGKLLMIILLRTLVIAAFFALPAPVLPATAVESDSSNYRLTSTVTQETLQANIREAEASTELDESTRKKLIELYRSALAYLEEAGAHDRAAREFRESRESAPVRARAIREELDKQQQSDGKIATGVTDKSPPAEIEQVLQKEKANLAAVDAVLSDLQDRLLVESDRPNLARQRLTAAKQRMEQISGELRQLITADESPRLIEAKRWAMQSESMALGAEIKMLDQELLSAPMRLELLEAERDKATSSLKRMRARIELLENLLGGKRVAEAQQTRTAAEQTQRESRGKHPLVQKLARMNAVLSEELGTLANSLEQATAEDDTINRQAEQIGNEFRSTRQKIELAGLGLSLGRVLYEQQRELPNPSMFRKQAREREKEITAAGLRMIQYDEERQTLGNVSDYVDELTASLPPEETWGIRDELEKLATNRKALLKQAIALNQAYLRALGEVEFAERQLLNTVKDYDAFIGENLLWIRSAKAPDMHTLREIPGQFMQLLSPGQWMETAKLLGIRAKENPFTFLLPAGLAGIILLRSGKLRAQLRATGNQVGKPRTDKYRYTFQALFLTLLLAAPWPLLLQIAGWQLGDAIEATDFAKAVSHALLWVAHALFYLQIFRLLCTSDGLAEAHFHWPGQSLSMLRRQLLRLTITFLPAVFLAVLTLNLSALPTGAGIERLAFVLVLVTLALFFYRLFSPGQGPLQSYMARNPTSLFTRLRHLWLVMSLAVPGALAGLAVAGYHYTAGILTDCLIETMWLILMLVIVHQLVARWLLLTRHRLAFKAAVKRREAARSAALARETAVPGGEGIAEIVEEPVVDLVALSDESRKLLNMAMVLIGIIGVWIIWSDVLPAFGYLDKITLWHHAVVINGESQQIPLTLADALLALIIAIGTVVAAKRFPALLEIFLLQLLHMSPGGRYTAITLSRYFIAGGGALLVISMLGGSWGQVQWLIAALGVGIGFGLQEIVANFISGLIILFERPIRVGDFVSVGDTDGHVTRIQIRATTIQTRDRKELLVPNKEFITGRLLNWSLSDQVTRIVIAIGVAYGSDVDQAMVLITEAAQENPHVLPDPPPFTGFEGFGDNSLNLNLRCFIDSIEYRLSTISELHQTINRKLNAAGIVIAYPQRDLHLDTTSPLDIRIRHDDGAQGAGQG